LKKVIVIAPHPDDELIGCGGTLLRYASENKRIGWIIVTSMQEKYGWSLEKIKERDNEIKQVGKGLKIQQKNIFQLNFPTVRLDTIPMEKIVKKLSHIIKDFEPNEIFIPNQSDIHSDHKIIFNAACSSVKWFRNPSINRILCYETISETDFSFENIGFKPNVYIDISETINKKIELLNIYKSEVGEFPFPRSNDSVIALSKIRGSQSGFNAAESFQLLYEKI